MHIKFKNKFWLLITFEIFLIFFPSVYAQNVAIDTTQNIANSSAILDLQSVTRGLLIPRMTTAQMNAISAPAVSLIIYNTTQNCYLFFNGTQWQTLSCYCSGSPSAPGTPVQSPSGTICAPAASVTYSVTAVSGVTYAWYVPPGGSITAGQGTNSITVSYSAKAVSGNLSVIATNSCGSSTPAYLSVTIYPTAGASTPGPILGLATVCSGTTQYFSISAVSNATSYTWTAPSGSVIASGQGTTAIVVTMGSTSGNVSVVATNTCGSSSASSLAITVLTSVPSAPSTLTPPATTPYMNSQGNVFSCSAVAGVSTYYWSISPVTPSSIITSGQGTTSITVNFFATTCNQNYVVSVYATNACGESSAKTYSFTAQNHGAAIFTYKGYTQSWVVPTCAVSPVTVELWGAGGGGGAPSLGGSAGGTGGFFEGTLSVITGSTIYIIVGGGGSIKGVGGYGGGGNGAASSPYYGGGGGGRSSIQFSLGADTVTAGGGGGGAYSQTAYYGNGGGGGNAPSGNGDQSSQCSGDYGYGASAAAGGAGGSDVSCGAGASYTGGTGTKYIHANGGSASSTVLFYGGGGGGGYWGGGAGANYYGSGGGGGTSFASGLILSVITNATGTTPINGTNYNSPVLPPNNSDINYISGVGTCESNTAGGNGEVIILF